MKRGVGVKSGGFSASVLAVLALLLFMTPARAQTDHPDTLWQALQNAEVAGSVMYFQRHRERYRVGEDRFGSNLHHRTLQSEIHVSTPYALGNTLGLEAGLFGTVDLANGAGAPDHEINFFPWQNPWSADWSKRDARGGFSLYRAYLKAQRLTEQWPLVGQTRLFPAGRPRRAGRQLVFDARHLLGR